MKAVFDKVEAFLNMMILTSKMLNEPVLVFDRDGLIVEGNDTAKISYLKVFVYKDFFIEYESGNQYCLKINDLISILKKIPSNAVVTLTEEDNWFVIKGKSSRIFKYKLQIIDERFENLARPKGDEAYEVEINMPSKIFKEMIEVGIGNSNIVLYCTEFYFSVQEDDLMHVSMQRIRSSALVHIKKKKEAKFYRSKYNYRDYIGKVVPYFEKLDDGIKIEFGNDFILRLSCYPEDFEVQFILAPIIENKDDEDAGTE